MSADNAKHFVSSVVENYLLGNHVSFIYNAGSDVNWSIKYQITTSPSFFFEIKTKLMSLCM